MKHDVIMAMEHKTVFVFRFIYYHYRTRMEVCIINGFTNIGCLGGILTDNSPTQLPNSGMASSTTA